MTERDDVPEVGVLDLALATAQLRERPGQLPVEVADRVLQRALATPRPAQLVRSGDPGDHVRVSTVALVALVQHRLDGDLVHAAVRRVRCDVTREGTLEAVSVDLIVRYPHPVHGVADQAHGLLRQVLHEVLSGSGAAAPHQHVHVGDVTVADPHLVDPFDEQ